MFDYFVFCSFGDRSYMYHLRFAFEWCM